MNHRTTRRSPATDAVEMTQLLSDDGALTYALKPAGAGLFIQRTQHTKDKALAVQCLLIAGHEEFRRWCDVEPARFDHPILFVRLQRCGNAVLDRSL
jgi:hypothetical protein